MRTIKPVWRGAILLVVGCVIGYFVGLLLDLIINGQINASGSVPAVFSLLIGATAFFYGLTGLGAATKGLASQVLGTITGALFVTGIRLLMGLGVFGNFFF